MNTEEKLREIMEENRQAARKYWLEKPELKLLSCVRFYSGAWYIYSEQKFPPMISPSFLQLLYRGLKQLLHLYYSGKLGCKNIRETDRLSIAEKEICFKNLFHYGYFDAYNDFIPVSDINFQGNNITIFPRELIQAEIDDFYRDSVYMNSSISEELTEKFFDENLGLDELFEALKESFGLQIQNCGFDFDAKFGGVSFVSYVVGALFLITKSYLHTNKFFDTDKNIYDTSTPLYSNIVLQKEMCAYINKYQKLLDSTAQDLSSIQSDVVFDFFSLNTGNYKKLTNVIYPDYFFIQLNDRFSTQIVKLALTDFTGIFQNLCRILNICFPKDWDKNIKQREKMMHAKLKSCLEPRFQVINSFKLKKDSKILTDIDSAIFDRKHQTIYFVQFKYQDEYINDWKQKRSKTEHLKELIEKWFCAIDEWLKSSDIQQFLKSVGVKGIRGVPKIRYIIFAQYNANQIRDFASKSDTIVTTDSLFYLTCKKFDEIEEVFGSIREENGKDIEAFKPTSELTTLGSYNVKLDYSHLGYDEEVELSENCRLTYSITNRLSYLDLFRIKSRVLLEMMLEEA